MVLINLDALSDSELRCIAEQDGLEDWAQLDRDDLIEQLQEKYDDDEPHKEIETKSKRFCTSLTNGKVGDEKAFDSLPGVESLPKTYNDTCIHMLLRDPQWAYAYWSISPHTRAELVGDHKPQAKSLFLRITMRDAEDKEKACFDISVGLDDDQWNINLPHIGYLYDVSLYATLGSGKELRLAQSNTIRTYASYWESHYDEIAMNAGLFRLQFSSVVTNRGEIADNPILRGIAKVLGKGVIE